MKKLKYLLVDDEKVIRDGLSAFLERYDIQTIHAEDALQARTILDKDDFDIVILDVIMPGENGLDLAKWIKEEKNIPVVLVTSLDETVDKIVGLEMGGDDYISKPFDPRELLARTKAILRRYQFEEQEQEHANSAFLTINLTERFIEVAGRRHQLNSSEYSLLKLLVDNLGEPVSRSELYSEVFKGVWHPESRAVDNIVSRMRLKTEQDNEFHRYIITVRHSGYMIPKELVQVIK